MNAAHSEVTQPMPNNPGETLRQARENKGWSVAEVAAQLNLTPQRLAQIEAGAFDKLPGTTFARGYIRAYAKLLELDQNRLVLEFDQFTGTDATGSNVHALGRIEEPVRYSQSILRLVSFLMLLALIGAGFLWWQDQGRPVASLADLGLEHVEVEGADGTTQVHSLAEPEDQAVVAAQGGEQSSPLLLPIEPGEAPEEPGAAEQPAAEPGVAEGSVADGAAGTPAAPAPSQPANAATAAPAVAPAAPVALPAGHGALNVQFTADCWTQVTDADGKVLLSALKRSGERIELTGKAPMELRLGFARGAQVTYNGESVDVAPYTSGETARLKLGL
ncbi:MAG: helix-turn-helix domain-containing protein [Pseudomonas sp.]|jgi:cytoskeleton protein RodZ|uniref:Cytoskeleton protein RodZ n=1 Tax=Ectopseudomonas guguanensis TaxID=1198456 RepID=A0A1H0X3N1_9GAMM|nr:MULTISPECIES: RodZ family helix-turn-helix domain-containing protein [Pseudomonas]MDR8016506.1 helix-turn-helix domain-containing protein [Pseudomonas guguanensis]MPT20278.1 helix-turn-helix domain-containing protein [Pseudomonas sp.]WJH58442.1 helix-turn-helix domain-containing protein [Pseudomonas guguanensis]SDP97568.1 cytoskeleton protein RodZ [Pseudomonas guguanensis]